MTLLHNPHLRRSATWTGWNRGVGDQRVGRREVDRWGNLATAER
jgi:hypothetical protein